MKLACWRAEALLDRRRAGLDEPERIRLEEHLSTCGACAERGNALARVVELVADGFELGPSQRSRALRRALSVRSGPAPVRAERPLWQWFFAPIAVSAVAIALLALVVPARGPSLRAFAAPRGVDGARYPDRLAKGDVSVGGAKLATGQAVAAGAELESESGATLRLAQAEVALAAGSRVRWDAGRRSVTLEAGSVHVEVDPRPKQSFGVETSRFRVLVLGTIFDVSLEDVSVSRGHVRVVAGELETDLFAGQGWRVEAPSTSPKPSVDVAGLLAQARARLAARDVAAARRAVNAALGAHPSTTEDAEARSLLADCALVSGDRAEAARRYAEVAREHAGTPAAETADFAAARLESDPSRARALLEAYLAEYPKGRFRGEAEQRLGALGQ